MRFAIAPSLGPATRKSAPNEQYDDGTYNGADEAGAFTGCVQAQCLAQECGHESPDYAEDGGQDKSRRTARPGHDELCDNSGYEPDEDGPENSHDSLPVRAINQPWHKEFHA
jgi:hypothetical protein